MAWLTDTLQVAALLLVSAGLSAGAITLAARLQLDRWWRVGPESADPFESLIERFAALADAARRGGVMSIESAVGELRMPILEQGLELLLAGNTTEEVRARLEAQLDSAGAGSSRSTVTAIMTVCGVMLVVIGGVGSVGLARSGEPSALLLTLASALIPGALALVGASVASMRVGQSLPHRILVSVLALETLCQISAGRDGRTTRAHLRAFLPVAAPSASASAAA